MQYYAIEWFGAIVTELDLFVVLAVIAIGGGGGGDVPLVLCLKI